MKMELLPELSEAQLDLEIDFGDRGGLQRLRTVGDVEKWIQEEVEFWAWLRQGGAESVARGLPLIANTFGQYEQALKQKINECRQQWTSLQKNIESVAAKEEHTEQDEKQYRDFQERANSALGQLQQNLKSHFSSFVLPPSKHRLRTEPISQFIKELAEHSPEEAVYALDQVLRDQSGRNDKAAEVSGRLMAVLFERNLNRKLPPDNAAFKEAVQTWSRELSEYKTNYNKLKNEYDELVEKNEETGLLWQKRTQEMEKQFSDQIEKNDTDLKGLKETYETHMALSAPTHYWKRKEVQHGRNILQVKKWLVSVSVITLLLLGVAAWFILPETGVRDELPWRNLGLFLLVSTFCLWFVRLLVKLLLSNIHLLSDAQERVVMIQTFMAMLRHSESREKLAKEDIALVLAPIFKPSTTGVIKDDGGPMTLSDFISRLGGK